MILPDLSCLHISVPTETSEQQAMDDLLRAYLFEPESIQEAEDNFKASRTADPAPTPVKPAPAPVDDVRLEQQRKREVVQNLFHQSKHCKTTIKESNGVKKSLKKKPNSWGALRQYFHELTPEEKYEIKKDYGYTNNATVYEEGHRQYQRAKEKKEERCKKKISEADLAASNETLTNMLGLPRRAKR